MTNEPEQDGDESGKIDFEFEELEFMGLIKENVGELTPYGKRLMKKYGKAIRSIAARVAEQCSKAAEDTFNKSYWEDGEHDAKTLGHEILESVSEVGRIYAPKKEGTE